MRSYPSIHGRLTVTREDAGYLFKGRVYLHGGVFQVPGGIVDARDNEVEFDIAFRVEPGYTPPYAFPIRLAGSPYSLVDYSLVYEHEPRVHIAVGPDSTIVITGTAYTMVDGLAYPHVYVSRVGWNVECDDLDCAYPFVPKGEPYRSIVLNEYMLLRSKHTRPHYAALELTCISGLLECGVLNKHWLVDKHPRIRQAVIEWLELLTGNRVSSLEPPRLNGETVSFVTHHPLAYLVCSEGKVVEEVANAGEERRLEGVCAYSFVCRHCLSRLY